MGCDDGGHGRQRDQGVQHPVGGQEVKGIGQSCRGPHEQRTLAEVLEQEGRQGHRKPAELDRPASEVAHVGIQRFGSREDQKDTAQHQDADCCMPD